MDPEADEQTVVRPLVPAVSGDADFGDADTADADTADADTIIKERQPFADIPIQALVELREPASSPASVSSIPGTPPTVDTVAIKTAVIDDHLGSTLPLDYTFRINTAEPIRLDAAAVIGRNPALPRIMQGRQPRLIRVPSPLKEVSNTHVELRQQGSLVIVTDLRTTNGSVVKVPGQLPIRLRQGESLVVSPGTVVEIGDGNVIEILSLQRAELVTS